jgi:cellulose synthase/poly-beta-1,6-N-acetylglucosamine synthase-like glycosyltransferase
MKQRRRWMNGALFGTASVIKNSLSMVSWSRNDHPFYRQAMMLFFMLYLITLYTLQFLIIGATFSSVLVFVTTLLKQVM